MKIGIKRFGTTKKDYITTRSLAIIGGSDTGKTEILLKNIAWLYQSFHTVKIFALNNSVPLGANLHSPDELYDFLLNLDPRHCRDTLVVIDDFSFIERGRREDIGLILETMIQEGLNVLLASQEDANPTLFRIFDTIYEIPWMNMSLSNKIKRIIFNYTSNFLKSSFFDNFVSRTSK